MARIMLVSLLHQLAPRFPVYSHQHLQAMLAFSGQVWVAPLASADLKALRQAAGDRPLHALADLSGGWSPVCATAERGDAGREALAQYDEELLGNLEMYWRSPTKINSPITDNLFELRREVVDEALGPRIAKAWQQGLEKRLATVLAAARKGEDQLLFVEVECAYWLRSRLAECDGIELMWPQIAD